MDRRGIEDAEAGGPTYLANSYQFVRLSENIKNDHREFKACSVCASNSFRFSHGRVFSYCQSGKMREDSGIHACLTGEEADDDDVSANSRIFHVFQYII